MSDRITEESRKVIGEAFGEFNALMRECAESGTLKGVSTSFASALLSAIADTTIEFIAREPARARRYTEAGYQAFWKAVTG